MSHPVKRHDPVEVDETVGIEQLGRNARGLVAQLAARLLRRRDGDPQEIGAC
jgi:hypothetical protein